jgi:hypothetical protein
LAAQRRMRLHSTAAAAAESGGSPGLAAATTAPVSESALPAPPSALAAHGHGAPASRPAPPLSLSRFCRQCGSPMEVRAAALWRAATVSRADCKAHNCCIHEALNAGATHRPSRPTPDKRERLPPPPPARPCAWQVIRPEGDNEWRHVCTSCSYVDYFNPKMVGGWGAHAELRYDPSTLAKPPAPLAPPRLMRREAPPCTSACMVCAMGPYHLLQDSRAWHLLLPQPGAPVAAGASHHPLAAMQRTARPPGLCRWWAASWSTRASCCSAAGQ